MRLEDTLIRRLYARAGAERWQLPMAAFAAWLEASARREFGEGQPDTRELDRHFGALHLEDLGLACACAEGIETAWDAFVMQHRPTLYRAADALDPSGGARDLADSLYGELFGLRSRDGHRESHLRYFHGRSSLATWLRAVLSQRYVDRRRQFARVEQLAEDDAEMARPAASSSQPATLLRFVEILRQVIATVVAALPSRDRLRLRCYYAQDMTLAEIGRMLGESEATASRSLARTRTSIRVEVERTLKERERMNDEDVAECFAAVVQDSGTLDLAELLGSAGEPAAASRRKSESLR